MECAEALDEVLRLAQRDLALQLALELLVERSRRLFVEHGLDLAVGEGWSSGEPLRDLAGFGRQCLVVDAGPDQAPGGGVAGRQPIAEQREPLAPSGPDHPRQVERTAEVGHQAEPRREQLQEHRRVRAEYDVAGKREAHARASGDALHRDDDRHRQMVPGTDHRIERVPQTRLDPLRRGLSQIRTGAKRPPAGAKQHGANVGVVADQPGRNRQFADQRCIERIQALRPVQRHVRNPVAPLEQQCLEEHTGSITYGIIGVEFGVTGAGNRLRLNLDQLPAALQRGLAGAYLVSGEEHLLLGEAADAIRVAARAQGYTDRRVFFVDRGFSWDELRNESQSLSLFAERRLFEFRLPTGKPDKGAAQLAELAASPPPDVITLVLTEKLDRKASDAAWVQAFAQHGAWVHVRRVGEAQLPDWLAARARSAGYQLEESAARLIAERTEGNLLAAHQELSRLGLLSRDGRIDVALVLQSVGDSARYDVMQLSTAAAEGDALRAVHILQGLHSEGVEPTLILWAVVRELRGLWQARERQRLRSGGASSWNIAAKPTDRALARLRSLPLPALLRQAGDADRIIKGMAAGDAWSALLGLVAAFAGALQPVQVSGRVA